MYVGGLSLIAVGLTTSVFLMNLAWVVLLAGWVAEGGWKAKMARGRESGLLMFFVALFVAHAAGMLWTENWQYGLYDIQKKLPLVAVPLVVLTSPPLGKKEMRGVMVPYCAAVFVVSLIGMGRYLAIERLPYREIVPFVSHIRFSLNVCLVLTMAFVALARRGVGWWRRVLLVLLMVWFLFFLLLIRSYTAFVILALLPVAYFAKRRVGRVVCAAVYGALLLVVGSVVGWNVRSYYGPCRADGPLVENGRYLFEGVDERSLAEHWPEYSAKPIDSANEYGYTLMSTVVRYLNSKGLEKNGEGLSRLSRHDIENIENGVANEVQTHAFSVRAMVYSMVFEYENYRTTGYIAESSFLQRIELWKASLGVIRDHPLFGVGTGDVVDELHARLKERRSSIAETTKHSHNQYLSLLMAFGVVGCVVAVAPLCIKGTKRSGGGWFRVVVWVIVLVSFLTEDTLETLAGVMFVALFVALSGNVAEDVPGDGREGRIAGDGRNSA